MPRWRPGQFPEGPPEGFNPEDPYADPVALVEQREYNVRQKAIQIERAKVITCEGRQWLSDTSLCRLCSRAPFTKS